MDGIKILGNIYIDQSCDILPFTFDFMQGVVTPYIGPESLGAVQENCFHHRLKSEKNSGLDYLVLLGANT
jgi:hypothetical protein